MPSGEEELAMFRGGREKYLSYNPGKGKRF
jgi:hypothetical protein